jgi:hypothetical protein
LALSRACNISARTAPPHPLLNLLLGGDAHSRAWGGIIKSEEGM